MVMQMSERIIVGWSGGKDSMMALDALRQDYEIAALVANFSESSRRLVTHGVPQRLIERQADALGLTLHPVYLPDSPQNGVYEARVGAAYTHFRQRGITTVAFGDLFLEDIRAYRDQHLTACQMTGIYPVWGQDTAAVARQFIARGFRAIVTCVDTTLLDAGFCGRLYDAAFLDDLPEDADPCGENGEFHTFVYDGPLFRTPVSLEADSRFVWAGRYCLCEWR